MQSGHRSSKYEPTGSWIKRREFLASSLALTLPLGPTASSCAAWSTATPRKKVAAVVTIYRPNSHADVLVGKILQGWKQDGGVGPSLDLVSMYVDQFPADDMSVALAAKHGFRLCKSIRQSIELDSDSVAVDGVLSIGEHGDYPVNPLGQQLYPRRRFFSEITDVLERHQKVIPIFNDKHPGPSWPDAQWMYQRAKDLGLPWMAGSSLTVGFRQPDVTLPLGDSIQSCIAVGYSGLDIYGFHTLDFLQSIVERRKTNSQGVVSVQALPLNSFSDVIKRINVDNQLLDDVLSSSGTSRQKLTEEIPKSSSQDTAIFVVRYADGLIGLVLMLGSFANAISAACRTSAGKNIVTRAEERVEPRYPHFAYLLKAIERMFHTGKPSYPVERTLLAAGVLDRALTSHHQNSAELSTPELNFNYACINYPHAPHILLNEP